MQKEQQDQLNSFDHYQRFVQALSARHHLSCQQKTLSARQEDLLARLARLQVLPASLSKPFKRNNPGRKR
jgi:hypothetical protein